MSAWRQASVVCSRPTNIFRRIVHAIGGYDGLEMIAGRVCAGTGYDAEPGHPYV